jgi:large repetitive protein
MIGGLSMRHAMSLAPARSAVLAVLLAATVALAVVIIAFTVAPKKADAETRIITRSFSNTNEILIPDSGPADPYPSFIGPSFPQGSKVRDVNVVLKDYSHTYTDDVDVMLVHRGTNRTIMSDVGGSNTVSNITIKLDDEASNPLSDQGQLTSGTFKPTNQEGSDDFSDPAPSGGSESKLSGFDGLRANGGWKLFVEDDAGPDEGEFGDGWTLRIKAAVPQ